MFGKKHAKTTKETSSLPGIDSRARFEVWIKSERPTILQENNDLAVCWQAAEADALERAAKVCDNASTIEFAECMGRNRGSDVALRIAAAIRELKE